MAELLNPANGFTIGDLAKLYGIPELEILYPGYADRGL